MQPSTKAGRPILGAAGLCVVLALTGCGSGVVRDPVAPPLLPGHVETRLAAGATVEVEGSAEDADRWARLVGPAVTRVRAVLRGSGALVGAPLLVEVAPDEASLERALHVGDGAERGVEAVSAPPPGAVAGTVPRIWVNAQAMDRLNHQGIGIVLTHEATHVLTGVVGDTAMPLWLVEGVADYVALADIHKPLAVEAGRILAEVRRGQLPSRLPLQADFDAARASGGSAYTAEYEASWLACRLLAQRGGRADLVHLYVAVRTGTTIDAALQSGFGLTLMGFTRLWQTSLTQAASALTSQ